MATYSNYTKGQLKDLLRIFKKNKNDLLSAYYGNTNESIINTAEEKMNIVIHNMETALTSDTSSEELNESIASFVNDSPVVKDSKKAIEAQNQAFNQAAENLIDFSNPLVSEVMRFSKKSGKNDPGHSILKTHEDKINAYKLLLQHKKEGTFSLLEQEENDSIFETLANEDKKETKNECMSRLKKMSLSELVEEYNNYINTNILEGKNVLTIAKMQHLEKAGHQFKDHFRNIGMVVGGGLLGIGITLTGAPLANPSLGVMLQYIGQAGAVTAGAIAGVTAIGVSARSVIDSRAGKSIRKKMSALSLENMGEVFDIVKQNQPSKDKNDNKNKRECISNINKELKKQGINIKLGNITYKLLSETENTISKYPLKISKTSSKSEKLVKKGMKKTTKVVNVENKEIAESILAPIFNDIEKLRTSTRASKAIDNLLAALNPQNIFKRLPFASQDSVANDDNNQTAVQQKGKKAKIEIEKMQGYSDVANSLMDESANTAKYELSTNKKLFKIHEARVSITLNKANVKLSEDQVNSIMNMIEKKINQQTFKSGSVTDINTGTKVDIEILSKGKPKTTKKAGNK